MINPTSGGTVLPFLDDYQPRLLTAADLAALPRDLPSGSVRYELHHGRLITMPPPGYQHGATELRIAAALLVQGEIPGHGKASCGDVGVVLSRNPDHVFGADAVFIANDRLPLKISSEGYLETIPHLVVEVRSKNDTLAALQRKATDYLAAGVVVVWIIDPVNRNIQELRQGTPPHVWSDAETLSVEDLIPGFSLSVASVLQE